MHLVSAWEESAGDQWGSGVEWPGSLISFAFEDRGEGVEIIFMLQYQRTHLESTTYFSFFRGS